MRKYHVRNALRKCIVCREGEILWYTQGAKGVIPMSDELERKTIRAWREENFLTLKELAEKVGVKLQTVWNWEHGKHPEFRNIRKLAEVFGIHPKQIILSEPDEGKEKPAA